MTRASWPGTTFGLLFSRVLGFTDVGLGFEAYKFRFGVWGFTDLGFRVRGLKASMTKSDLEQLEPGIHDLCIRGNCDLQGERASSAYGDLREP